MAAARPTISQLLEINERHQELRNENDRRQRETARLRDPRTISSARVVSSRLLQGVSKVIDNLDFSSINVLNAFLVTSIGRVHKVLHCTSGGRGKSPCCGTTWNRDTNASLNLLRILDCELSGIDRPRVFQRNQNRK
jgi:hypothetical protein